MASKLTDQQRENLRASHGQPVMVEDDLAQRTYDLVDPDYLHTSHDRLKDLIAQGMQSNHVDADIAEKRLRRYADMLDARHYETPAVFRFAIPIWETFWTSSHRVS